MKTFLALILVIALYSCSEQSMADKRTLAIREWFKSHPTSTVTRNLDYVAKVENANFKHVPEWEHGLGNATTLDSFGGYKGDTSGIQINLSMTHAYHNIIPKIIEGKPYFPSEYSVDFLMPKKDSKIIGVVQLIRYTQLSPPDSFTGKIDTLHDFTTRDTSFDFVKTYAKH